MRAYERFLNYITYDTMADAIEGEKGTVPSSPGQLEFAGALMEELSSLGVTDAKLDEKGFIYGRIPSNMDESGNCPVIGFIAHMDTATTFPGPGNTARLITDYDGKPVILNSEVTLDPEIFPALKAARGKDIIVTNGKTLLGGDNKAGVAEIITAIEYMMNHPEYKHGEVAFIFTPDEEIGGSTKNIDVKKSTAALAYTLDGEAPGMIEYQSFCTGAVTLEINGVSAHPAYGKDILKNALIIGNEFHSMLPAWLRPEHTENYDGYYHLVQMEGNPQHCKMAYLIRFYTEEEYRTAKERISRTVRYLNFEYGEDTVTAQFIDGRKSMTNLIEKHRELIDYALDAIKACGITPVIPVMRGGTDGVALTEMGLPCPNLGTGSYNHHAVTEFAIVQEMDKCVELILRLVKRFAGQKE